jgi:hypothetical protein
MQVSKTLRLSMIATLLLGTSVLGIMSYRILFPEEVKQAEPAPPPPKRRVVRIPVPAPETPRPRATPEEAPSVRIITLKRGDKEGSSFIERKCWNLKCETPGEIRN